MNNRVYLIVFLIMLISLYLFFLWNKKNKYRTNAFKFLVCTALFCTIILNSLVFMKMTLTREEKAYIENLNYYKECLKSIQIEMKEMVGDTNINFKSYERLIELRMCSKYICDEVNLQEPPSQRLERSTNLLQRSWRIYYHLLTTDFNEIQSIEKTKDVKEEEGKNGNFETKYSKLNKEVDDILSDFEKELIVLENRMR